MQHIKHNSLKDRANLRDLSIAFVYNIPCLKRFLALVAIGRSRGIYQC
jgi:hypothetical protein